MGVSINGMPPISLDKFCGLAMKQDVDLDASIKVGLLSHELKTTSFSTRQSTNIEMCESFIAAVRAQLGDDAARIVEKHLCEPGKPLTARQIRASINAVTAEVTAKVQSKAVDAGVAKGTSVLDGPLDVWMGQRPECAKWSPLSRELFKGVVVRGQAAVAHGEEVDVDDHFMKAMAPGGMAERVLKVLAGQGNNTCAHVMLNTPPDKLPLLMEVREMCGGNSDPQLLLRIASHADELAALKASGKLNLENAWPKLFEGEALPAEHQGGKGLKDFSVSAHQCARVMAMVPPEVFADDPTVIGKMNELVFADVPPEDIASVIQRGDRPFEMKVPSSMRAAMLVGVHDVDRSMSSVEGLVSVDLFRLAPTFRIVGAQGEQTRVYDIGALEQKGEMATHAQADVVARNVMADITSLCGAKNTLQIMNVASALTQNSLACDGGVDKAACPPKVLQQGELKRSEYTLSKEQDGSVLVSFKSGPGRAVAFDRTYRFLPDGRQELVECPSRLTARDVAGDGASSSTGPAGAEITASVTA